MNEEAAPRGVVLQTDRLILRPWVVAEAGIQRELWSERDPRVPPHRRLDAQGRPTLAELEEAIRTSEVSDLGLLAVTLRQSGQAIGYCGLSTGGAEAAACPELAFEFLRRTWGHGYATEASLAVLDWARSSGVNEVRASVWEWNTASRRVLAKLGFVETGRVETADGHGTTVITTRGLVVG